tara:strand:- start:44376 stop:44636 length:261 start_codon:yes stop_codon:yes gene_type:complete
MIKNKHQINPKYEKVLSSYIAKKFLKDKSLWNIKINEFGVDSLNRMKLLLELREILSLKKEDLKMLIKYDTIKKIYKLIANSEKNK